MEKTAEEQKYYIYKNQKMSSQKKIVHENLTMEDAQKILLSLKDTKYYMFTIVPMLLPPKP